ncbi:uncharacterized protein LOC144912282 [Branchiostoma floridae x Branchiostoma belcheri]
MLPTRTKFLMVTGRYSSHWNPRGRGGPWYIIFDLVVPYTLFKIRITNYGDRTHDVSMFLLEASASSDPYSWEDVVTVTEVAASSEIQEFGGFSATGRFWKLNITNTHGTWQPWLREVNFFGAALLCHGPPDYPEGYTSDCEGQPDFPHGHTRVVTCPAGDVQSGGDAEAVCMDGQWVGPHDVVCEEMP